MDGNAAAAILGVPPGATKREISRAFRARAKVVHPDASGSDEAFIMLRAAFELLHTQAPEHHPAPGHRRARREAMTWHQVCPSTPSIVDLADAPVRSRPARSNTVSSLTVPGPQCDARGMTFTDHLVAQLGRHPA